MTKKEHTIKINDKIVERERGPPNTLTKIKIKCPKCQHEWNYGGKATDDEFVTCSKCHRMRLLKNYIHL